MSLEISHDFLNQPYVEGNVDGNHIIDEPSQDLGSSSSRSRIGVSNLIVWNLGILLFPIAVCLLPVMWKSCIDQNAPELLCISIGSIGIAAYFVLRNSLGFAQAFGCSVLAIFILFFIFVTVFTFVIPIPALAAPFSINTFLLIGLIGFLTSLAPSFMIAVLSGIRLHFKKQHQCQ